MFVLLEECRKLKRLKNFIYGSSSAVYGGNRKVPFSETDQANQPRSIYAASKRADELLAAAYSNITQVPMTGLRLFAVYGPWGRPDMFYYTFTQAIAAKRPIRVYNKGDFRRDFTYVDDAVLAIIAALDQPLRRPDGIAADAFIPHQTVNIGNDRSNSLSEFIGELEKALGIPAIIENEPMKKDDLQVLCFSLRESAFFASTVTNGPIQFMRSRAAHSALLPYSVSQKVTSSVCMLLRNTFW